MEALSITSVDDPRLVQLTDDVYVFAGYPFSGLVVTDAGCIVMDGPMRPNAARRWRDIIESHGVGLRYQVYCEHHTDHTPSAHYLEPEVLVSSERARTEMPTTTQMLDAFANWYDHDVEDIDVTGFEMRYPDITFNRRLNLTLGGKRFVLFEAPGHTLGSIVVHAVDDRVAFIADNGAAGAIHSGDLYSWLASVAVIEMLDVDWYVQGHGMPFQRDHLDLIRASLLGGLARGRETRAAGLTPSEVGEQGGLFEFPPMDPGPGDPFPSHLAERIGGNVFAGGAARVYEQLDRHPSAPFVEPDGLPF